jgi:hypothetical protein
MPEGRQPVASPSNRSNDELLASYAHLRLNQERARLLREAANQRAKHPVQADLTLARANALKVALNFFRHLQKGAPEGAKTASE